MAFGGKDWRKIVVVGAVSHWRSGDSVLQALGTPSAVLQVRPDVEPARHLSVSADRCGPSRAFQRTITPGVVRACIESAGAAGWPALRPHFHTALLDRPVRAVSPRVEWLTDTATAVAWGIALDNAPDRLPILADALQDAGCEDEGILGHLRGAEHHTGHRCWALGLTVHTG